MSVNWFIIDRRNNKLRLELWNDGIVARLLTPSLQIDKKSKHTFIHEGKPIETFKFYFNVSDLLSLKRMFGETIREIRTRHKEYLYNIAKQHYAHKSPDKLVLERAGITTFCKMYFKKEYRATMFLCNLKSLVLFRRKISDTIIDIELTKKQFKTNKIIM